jgi:hypothetical protein
LLLAVLSLLAMLAAFALILLATLLSLLTLLATFALILLATFMLLLLALLAALMLLLLAFTRFVCHDVFLLMECLVCGDVRWATSPKSHHRTVDELRVVLVSM